jgi:hypothetical protein
MMVHGYRRIPAYTLQNNTALNTHVYIAEQTTGDANVESNNY